MLTVGSAGGGELECWGGARCFLCMCVCVVCCVFVLCACATWDGGESSGGDLTRGKGGQRCYVM